MPNRVLVVDDRTPLRTLLADELSDAGFQVTEAVDGREAWQQFERDAPDLVVTDLVIPGSGGLELLAKIRRRSAIPVIVFAADASAETAVAALKAGADEFIPARGDAVAKLVDQVRHCVGRFVSATAPPVAMPLLAGESAAMQRVRERMHALASLEEPVLIVGEPGSGRDSAARYLHELAGSAAPFVRIGPEPGGPPPIPLRGTLYLDALDRFEPERRRAFLRRLSEGGDRRVGGPRFVVSVDGLAALEAQETPWDASYLSRLRRFEVWLPPLRERPEDVPRIARALLERFGRELRRPGLRFDEAAMQRLRSQPWPGNVAELARIIEKLVAFSDGGTIRRSAVDSVLSEYRFSVAALRDRAAARERAELVAALTATAGNVTRTAELLGRSRAAVYRLVDKHGVPLRRDR